MIFTGVFIILGGGMFVGLFIGIYLLLGIRAISEML
jgi:hypothetical protein